MNYTLIQRLRGQGIVVHLLADDKTIEIYGPAQAGGGRQQRQSFFGIYGAEILNELRAEHDNGRRIAQRCLQEPVLACKHVWALVPGPGLQPICCEVCGAPA